MQHSNLKPGDHYRLIGPNLPCIFRHDPEGNSDSHRCTSVCVVGGPQDGAIIYAGQWVLPALDHDIELMTKTPMGWAPTAPAPAAPGKRSLPTITLDALFTEMTKPGTSCCWLAKYGPIGLADRLRELAGASGPAARDIRISIRHLHNAVKRDAIAGSDVAWVMARFPSLRPEGYGGGTWGSKDMTEALDAWENPKPALPPVTLTLDGETASILRRVLDNIGGEPAPGHPRGRMETIRGMLHDQGVREARAGIDITGTIHLDKSK